MVVSIDVEYGFSTAAVTDPGRRWRHNEDYAGYSVPKDIIERRTYGALFVVCDGDGSSMTSGLASERTVVTVLEEYYRMPADIPPEQRLEQAIQLANKAVYEDNQAHPESKEVSTTIVAAVVIANRLIVAHAGNSRAYLIRRGVCRQLTEDHAITAGIVESEALSQVNAREYPMRRHLLRSIGYDERVAVEIKSYTVQAGDSLLLCTDGLANALHDEDITAALRLPTIPAAARQLLETALARDRKDNVTALLANVLPISDAELEQPQPQAERRQPFWHKMPVWLLAVLGTVLVAVVIGGGLLLRQALGSGNASRTPTASASPQAKATSAGGEATRGATAAPSAMPAPTATATLWPAGGEAQPLERYTLIVASDRDGNMELYRMRADGSQPERLTDNPELDYAPAVSRQGDAVVFHSARAGKWAVFLMDLATRDVLRLTDPEVDSYYPTWSPDGQQILFTTNRDGNEEVYVMNRDGSGQRNLTNHPGADRGAMWSPDGSRIAFVSDRDGNTEVYTMNPDGTGLTNLSNDPEDDWDPAWSPDGRRIAWISGREEGLQLWTMAADGSDKRRLTEETGMYFSPSWSPDGAYIAFDSGVSKLIYICKADGSDLVEITTRDYATRYPVWLPVIAAPEPQG